MAGYIKNIEQPSGVTAGYHVVERGLLTFPAGSPSVEIVIRSYVNKAAYDGGKEPVSIKTHTVTDSDKLAGILTAADGLTLSLPDFAGATKG